MSEQLDVQVDEALVRAFEDQLDPAHPERGAIPARIAGYGEISTVFLIGDQAGTVYKRMTGFSCAERARRHADIVHAYCDAIRARGVNVASTKAIVFENRFREHVLYLAQPPFDSEAIGNRLLAAADDVTLRAVLNALLAAFTALWQGDSDAAAADVLGIDGQISNWAFPNGPLEPPIYLDIGLPLIRRNGRELLDIDVVYKTMPPLVRHAVRAAFGQEVLDRYYVFREVLIDLLANFHKEGYPEKIGAGIDCVNELIAGPSHALAMSPITRAEVDAYYRRDARIWRIFLGVRRADRWVRGRLLHRRYPFVLPGKIRR